MLTKNEIENLVLAGVITDQQGIDIEKFFDGEAGLEKETVQNRESNSRTFSIAKTLYYLGGFLVVLSISYFLGNNWEQLGNVGRICSTLLLIGIFGYAGIRLKRTQYRIAGSMLLLAAMVAVPLCIHSIERATGLWPATSYGIKDLSYKNYLELINTAWIVLDVLTLAIAGIVFYKFKDPILSLPVAHFFWFLVLDGTNAIMGSYTFDMEKIAMKAWVSVVAGTLLVLWGVYYHKKEDNRVGVWPWIYGLAIVLGSLIDLRFDQANLKLLFQFLILALGIVVLLSATPLKSRTFLVFGSLAIFWFIQDSVWTYFTDSLGFSAALLFSGILTIIFGILTQRHYKNNFAS